VSRARFDRLRCRHRFTPSGSNLSRPEPPDGKRSASCSGCSAGRPMRSCQFAWSAWNGAVIVAARCYKTSEPCRVLRLVPGAGVAFTVAALGNCKARGSPTADLRPTRTELAVGTALDGGRYSAPAPRVGRWPEPGVMRPNRHPWREACAAPYAASTRTRAGADIYRRRERCHG